MRVLLHPQPHPPGSGGKEEEEEEEEKEEEEKLVFLLSQAVLTVASLMEAAALSNTLPLQDLTAVLR